MMHFVGAANSGVHWGTIAQVFLAAVVALATVIFGIPAWRLSRAKMHDQHIAQAVARVIGLPAGNLELFEPSRENPSLIDLLKEIRDNASETAQTSALLAHHMADGHGGQPPRFPRTG